MKENDGKAPISEAMEARMAALVEEHLKERGGRNIHVTTGKEAGTLDVKCSMPNAVLGTLAHQGVARMQEDGLSLNLRACWPKMGHKEMAELTSVAGDIFAALNKVNEETGTGEVKDDSQP